MKPGLTPGSGRGRSRKKPRALPPANRHPQLISDWVEVFAPMIWAAYAPTTWPAKIAIDDMGFRHGREGAARGDRAFSVLAAVGYRDDGRTYIAAIQAVPQSSAAAWQTLLRTLEGQPAWVVGDGSYPLRAAEALWSGSTDPDLPVPPVQTYRCEWHLSRGITMALPSDVKRDKADPIHTLIPDAVHSLAGWKKAFDLVLARAAAAANYQGATVALLRLHDVVQHQQTIKTAGPRSTGAVEEFFRQLQNTIGDRASRLTNKTRTDALLKLIACQRNGWAHESAWADLIRETLATTGGRPPQQRAHSNPRSDPSLKAYPRQAT